MNDTKFFKRADLAIVLVFALVSIALLVPGFLSKSPSTALIYSKGEVIRTVELNKVTEKEVLTLDSDPKVEITIEPGLIYYSHAECPDKLCEACGKLSRPGQSAACLPSETLIVIKGEKSSSDPDGLTY